MSILKRICVILAVTVLVASCRKSTNANWDVGVVLPVVTSSLNISNFAEDSLFKADASGLLHLTIKRELAALMLDSLLQIPDTTFSKPFVNDFFAPVPLQPGQSFSLVPSDLKFNIGNNIALKRADIRQGVLSVKF